MDDDFTAYMEYVPDGCVPVFGVRVVGYMDDNGDICGAWHLDGTTDKGIIVGHLEIAKHHIIASKWHEPEDD